MDDFDQAQDDNKYEKVRFIRNSRIRQGIMWTLVILVGMFVTMNYTQQQHQQQQQGKNLETLRVKGFGNEISSSSSNMLEKQPQNQKSKHQQQQQDLIPLIKRFKELDGKVREYKNSIASTPNVFMETDPTALQWTKQLQSAVRELLLARYGPPPYRVHMVVEFPPSIPDTDQHKGPTGTIVLEMANIDHVPVSVFYYMEIVRTFVSGAFHRNAGHVLQVMMRTKDKFTEQSLPFQEYSEQTPHLQYTTGYAGRPSGPGWYVSLVDNSRNHGPGSQQKENPHEADACFGTVVQGVETGVISRIHSVKQQGWLDQSNQVKIRAMNILTAHDGEDFHVWEEKEEQQQEQDDDAAR